MHQKHPPAKMACSIGGLFLAVVWAWAQANMPASPSNAVTVHRDQFTHAILETPRAKLKLIVAATTVLLSIRPAF